MEPLIFLITSILSFLGLFVGMILVKIAPEEKKPGKKHFLLLQNITFSLSVLFLLYYLKLNILIIILMMIILIIMLIKQNIRDNIKRSMIFYFLFSLIFVLSVKNDNLFLIESVSVFIFGMATGSILLKKKNHLEIILKNSIFFITILPFLFTNL